MARHDREVGWIDPQVVLKAPRPLMWCAVMVSATSFSGVSRYTATTGWLMI
ncbi:MAG TPA: hypothetical protein VEP50_11165 [bacterium]|nr:hypothetical protein [bacterium]